MPALPWALGAFRGEQWERASWHRARWTGTDVPGLLAAKAGGKEKEVVTVRLPTRLSASGHLSSTWRRGEGDIRTTYSVIVSAADVGTLQTGTL